MRLSFIKRTSNIRSRSDIVSMKVAIYARVSTDDKSQDPLNQLELASSPLDRGERWCGSIPTKPPLL